MKLPWFKRIGIFFVPISIMGWLVFLGAIVYLIYAFIDIDGKSNSISDTLINFVFNALMVAAVYSILAYLTIRIKIQ